MKQLIIKLLRNLGYSLTKTNRIPIFKNDQTVNVGKYTLLMPAINPLIHVYRENKDFASEIGRIAAIVHKKYPALHFIDVGANAGDTTAIVTSVADIPVTCIEGDEFTFSYLIKNAKQFHQVETIRQFLGERDETKSIRTEKSGWNTTLIPAESIGTEIQLMSLDTIMNERYKEGHLYKLLKIDTEGFDTIILRGATEILTLFKPVIYLEYNRDNMKTIGEDGISTLFSLEKLGYNHVLFFDDVGRYILSSSLANKPQITELHNYADGKNGLIYYYNLCIIHEEDTDLANAIINAVTHPR